MGCTGPLGPEGNSGGSGRRVGRRLPDGSFQPEKTITRAEFTKLLLDAIHLTPDSETVAWMTENATTKEPRSFGKKYVPILNDMDGHWLTTQGWTDAALYSGMVVPMTTTAKTSGRKRRSPGTKSP